ncbi:LPS export ABC transporter periplasmic protein LptC [Altererythrobacter aurantiacus]|uniref:LPS export ABC transporter periplasmic protein LptC n=1 Tax=Parapontixanthobacter aurantiacus TaxID=1463599 RepID=A0A844ZE03_9SPHN|nr:LPS export ABC transporter periplasmic protein LptC [Parapontixanthobacter aurantiacus]MXO86115.1 LPS export ABC transporter periplasmic protein LptC [Parapontixanthobacter aurantiacus]
MGKKRRIETEEAKKLRGKRQFWATPGGSHDRLVRVLASVLPIGVGIMAALMVITPLSPRGEVSFLLDRNKVAVIDERLRVDNALYRGQDNDGRPFSLTAGEAVQKSSAEGIVRMRDLVARILLDDGPARLGAEAGAYDISDKEVNAFGPVVLTGPDDYRMVVRGVDIDLDAKVMTGAGGVEGRLPGMTFSANRMVADLEERNVVLTGNSRGQIIPGALRMPQ